MSPDQPQDEAEPQDEPVSLDEPATNPDEASEEAPAASYTDTAWPCFEIYRDAAGLFRWRLRDGTGHVLAASRSYESRPECVEGVEAVKSLAPDAPVIDEETPGATAPPFAAT